MIALQFWTNTVFQHRAGGTCLSDKILAIFWENPHKVCSRERCAAALLVYSCHWYTPKKKKEKQKLNMSCRSWLLLSLTTSYRMTWTTSGLHLCSVFSLQNTFSASVTPPGFSLPTSVHTVILLTPCILMWEGKGVRSCPPSLFYVLALLSCSFFSSFPVCFPSTYSVDIRDKVTLHLRSRIIPSEGLRLSFCFQFFHSSCTDISDGSLVHLGAASGHKPKYIPLLPPNFQRFSN